MNSKFVVVYGLFFSSFQIEIRVIQISLAFWLMELIY